MRLDSDPGCGSGTGGVVRMLSQQRCPPAPLADHRAKCAKPACFAHIAETERVKRWGKFRRHSCRGWRNDHAVLSLSGIRASTGPWDRLSRPSRLPPGWRTRWTAAMRAGPPAGASPRAGDKFVVIVLVHDINAPAWNEPRRGDPPEQGAPDSCRRTLSAGSRHGRREPSERGRRSGTGVRRDGSQALRVAGAAVDHLFQPDKRATADDRSSSDVCPSSARSTLVGMLAPPCGGTLELRGIPAPAPA
jgi:hypothetical protein